MISVFDLATLVKKNMIDIIYKVNVNILYIIDIHTTYYLHNI